MVPKIHKINILQAMRTAKPTWNLVSPNIIKHFWGHPYQVHTDQWRLLDVSFDFFFFFSNKIMNDIMLHICADYSWIPISWRSEETNSEIEEGLKTMQAVGALAESKTLLLANIIESKDKLNVSHVVF